MFLDCLRQAIWARGVPTRLYMDNAKIYRSPQLARIAASIGILIIHTPPYQPEGRGQIERFFRSVREQFLADLDPKALLSLDQLNERLNERLWHWLDTVYHRREHSSLQTTPLLRWQRDIAQVRQLPPAGAGSGEIGCTEPSGPLLSAPEGSLLCRIHSSARCERRGCP